MWADILDTVGLLLNLVSALLLQMQSNRPLFFRIQYSEFQGIQMSLVQNNIQKHTSLKWNKLLYVNDKHCVYTDTDIDIFVSITY